MRVLVLMVAVLLSSGSAKNAQQRHAVRTWSCSSATMTPMQQQNCVNTANVQYAVETQRELVDEQNAGVAQAQAAQQQQAASDQQRALYEATVRRCDAVTRGLMACQMVTPTDALASRDYCIYSCGMSAPPRAYGVILCYEQAADCDGLKWCLSH